MPMPMPLQPLSDVDAFYTLGMGGHTGGGAAPCMPAPVAAAERAIVSYGDL